MTSKKSLLNELEADIRAIEERQVDKRNTEVGAEAGLGLNAIADLKGPEDTNTTSAHEPRPRGPSAPWAKKGALPVESTYTACIAKAFDLIAMRGHTAKELTDKLFKREFEPEHVDRAIERVCELGYIDEHEIASRRARRLATEGRGPLWIRDKLGRAGISDAIVSPILDELDDELSWDERAHDWLVRSRKLPAAGAERALVNRAYGRLARRGFPASIARAAIFDVGER